MSITQTFDLNLIPEQAPVVVHCDQYDEGTGRLIIKLFEGDVAYTPTGTASIQGRKPDGHGFQYSATLAGNTVTADLTFQMSCVSGRVRCQVVVTESTGRTGTFAFILDVQPSALPSDTDLSDSDYQFVQQAIDAAEDAEAWAVGERGGVPVDPSDETYHNNAEYWAYMASQYAQGGLVFKGSVAFASIPTTGMNDGDMYNITDDFTTDSRFIEGSGKFCPAGTNIAWVNSASKWDLLSVMKLGSLDDLNDVDVNAPSDKQVLTYDANSGEWINANAQAGAAALDDLTDVDITSPSNGQILQYNSTSQEWENASPSTPDIDDLGDVTITSPSDGQVLKYDGNSGEWVNGSGGGGGATDLDDLTDVTITTPTDGQALLYDAANQIWKNGTVSGGGDYVGLYGMTEIQSSDGQGTTLLDLDTYTTVGNYYCNAKAKISLMIYQNDNLQTSGSGAGFSYTSAIFVLTVKRLPNNNVTQEITIVADTLSEAFYRRYIRYYGVGGWTYWSRQGSNTGYTVSLTLNNLTNVTVPSPSNGDALVYQTSNTRWVNKPINKVTSLAVDLQNWTSDTTSQSGTTLYKKQISLNHVYVESPTVDIGSSGVLPTVAEQESYNLLQYVTCDDSVPCLYLYASAIPTTAFYINVVGVD